MNVLFDNNKLLRLLANLYTLTGIRANVFDLSGRDLCLDAQGTPFCHLLQATPGGHARCVECDRRAISNCGNRESAYFYRCHAGICEAVLPIRSNGRPLAYLLFGQFLDSAPREAQWERSLKNLGWYPGSMEELHAAFDNLRQCTDQEVQAYLEILKALQSYIYLSGMICAAEYTNQQKLELYLDQHYMEKLSLASISQDLNIGRTKLCALAKSMSGGHTLSDLISQRRIQAAKALLLQSNAPISAVGDAVGISDYNYFSKVFRAATGMTPSAFRKAGLAEHESTGWK